MENSGKFFISFPSDRVCDYSNPDILHFDHPACCRSQEFTAWRDNYLRPLLDWEYENPLPPFKRVRRCIKELATHKDNPYCCNMDVKQEYNNFINANFKILPLTYIPDLTWPQLQKYCFPDPFRAPISPIQGAFFLKKTLKIMNNSFFLLQMQRSENLSSVDLKLKVEDLEEEKKAMNNCFLILFGLCSCLCITIVFLSVFISDCPYRMPQNSTLLDPESPINNSIKMSTT